MFLTVFTATYNRAYIIKKLFESLCKQDFSDFEWVIVDDGSTDNTQELIMGFKEKAAFPVKYLRTSNGGKHRAINSGLELASGELFYIVDSDDFLPPNALKIIYDEWESIPRERRKILSGLCGEKKIVGVANDSFPMETIECSSFDFRYKHKVYVDKAEVFRTSILRQFRFPTYDGEKFVPEAYVWDLTTSHYPMHYFNTKIYYGEYIEDGYTKNFKRNLKCNPQGFALFYRGIMKNEGVPLRARLKALVRLLQCNYYRFHNKSK